MKDNRQSAWHRVPRNLCAQPGSAGCDRFSPLVCIPLAFARRSAERWPRPGSRRIELLAGKFTQATRFPASDHRNYNRDGGSFNVGETFAGLPFERGVELADALKPLVPDGLTMADLPLRWCLDFDAVSVIIPGAKSPAQARLNAHASDLARFSGELHTRLAEYYRSQLRDQIRGRY